MRHAFSCGALALLVLLTIILGAARPFERVAAGDPAYSKLAVLDSAGLLQGFALPQGELSRLEVAVLLQTALGSYGEAQLAGRQPDPVAEQALSDLLSAFSDELGQLGVKSSGLPVLAGEAGLVQRLADNEDDEDAAEEDASNTYLASLYPQEDSGDETGATEADGSGAIETTLYGRFNLQAQSRRTTRLDDTTDDFGDVSVYWGEVGWDVSHKDWSARLSMLWDDADETMGVYEAWARYQDPGSGWFAQLGRIVLPFGNNDYYSPTYPAVNDLGYTTARTAGTGVEREGWGVSAYAFNPEVSLTDEDESVSDYSVVWNISTREADECRDGWKLRAGYITHLGSSDLRLGGEGPHHKRAAAYNVFGRYDWGGNRFHLLADYTAAPDEFDERDLDANSDHVGDQPSALNTEFVYEPHPDNLYGVTYQTTDEMADYAETRYGLLFGKRLSDLAMLKVEYTHGVFGAYVTDEQDEDDTLVAEVSIEF